MNLVALSLLSLMATPPLGQARLRYAVVVGNNQGRTDELPLRYAEQDAARMAAVLRRLGGVPAQNTTLLLGEDASSIRRAILDVNARIRREGEGVADSMLFVYYSGHADVEGLHPGPETLRYGELKAMVAGSSARARVLILDGCRSGGLTNVKGASEAPVFSLGEPGGAAQGIAMISSSAAGEDSQESERLGASFFSHHLLNAFLGAGDANADGKITLNEAYKYAYHNTLRSSGRTVSLQHPTYAYELKGRSALVITQLFEGQKPTGHLALGSPGLYLIMRDQEAGEVVAEVNAPSAGTRLALSPGRYFVQRRARDHYREYEVELAANAQVDLSDRAFREVGYARLVRKGAARTVSHAALVLLAGRGPVLQGQGPMGALIMEYRASFPWASLALRARLGQALLQRLNDVLEVRHQELAGGLSGQRFFDLPFVSLGVGLVVEMVYHRQSFQSAAPLASRTSLGVTLGALLSAEVELFGPLVARIEGGPVTYLFRRAQTQTGEVVEEKLSSSVTGWGALGLGWRF